MNLSVYAAEGYKWNLLLGRGGGAKAVKGEKTPAWRFSNDHYYLSYAIDDTTRCIISAVYKIGTTPVMATSIITSGVPEPTK